MRKQENLQAFSGQYPYGSELFGVYQTLLGWKGTRARAWFAAGYERERKALRDAIYETVRGVVATAPNADGIIDEFRETGIGVPAGAASARSPLLEALARQAPTGAAALDPNVWRARLPDDVLMAVLNREVRREAQRLNERPIDRDNLEPGVNPFVVRSQGVLAYLDQESRIAGTVKLLRDGGAVPELQKLFSMKSSAATLDAMVKHLDKVYPYLYLDPTSALSAVLVSPIGAIHLFRQYFFELDSFIGQPVGHVWVAPHTTVELVEINTRRTIQEHTFEETSFSHTESFDESFALDSLHVAVAKANQQDLSFGASVSGSHSWIVGSVQASASMNYHNSQSDSRLTVHDTLRRRTQRAASVMERSVKTSFKTVTDQTEISSKKYVVSNPTPDLLNYELRRKMRRVAVQVQDVGTYLSWQSFVDEPGRELGVANLLHLAEPPNLANIPHPEMILAKDAERTTSEIIAIPFQPEAQLGMDAADEGDNEDQYYKYGVESSIGYLDSPQAIKWRFPQRFRTPDPDYRLRAVRPKPRGDIQVGVNPEAGPYATGGDGYASFELTVQYVHFHGALEVPVELELVWESLQDRKPIEAENAKRMATFVAAQKRAYEEAYVKAARERVTAASKIPIRPYEDLRQEERIAVYRRLINSLAPGRLATGESEALGGKKFSYTNMSDQTRHAWSEVLNRLFDLEKMLYFVAPEWWKPRARQSLAMGSEEPVYDKLGNVQLDANGNIIMKPATRTPISERFTVSWGGGAEAGRPNYYITEGSATAPLGSSLGWLLQLDGDAMRNAFLNAPWVKAVVPIRPGMERAAIAWLKDVAEGAEGLDAALEADLLALADAVAAKHALSNQVQQYPDLVDPDTTVPSTPVDRVFEFGFDPLPGGFRATSLAGSQFETIDQWIEVVPTDQVVAVEVQYDPITGRQVPLV